MRRLLSCLALPLIFLNGDSFSFDPRDGQSLVRTIEGTTELQLTESSSEYLVDGEAQEIADDGFELAIDIRFRSVYEDELLETGENEILKLRRQYAELEEEADYAVEAGEHQSDETLPSSSELEGRSVLFARDEKGDWEASFSEDDAGDEELLIDLEADMDLLALLPPGAVEVGSTWEIDVRRWRSIDSPGGDLKLVEERDDPEEDLDEAAYYDNLRGEVMAEYRGRVEVDGQEMLQIHFEGALESEIEGEVITGDADDLGGEVESVEKYSFEVEVAGDLYWDPELGLAHSMELESEIEMTIESEQSMTFGETEVKSTTTQAFQGVSRLQYTLELED